jgi:hypothetical protein
MSALALTVAFEGRPLGNDHDNDADNDAWISVKSYTTLVAMPSVIAATACPPIYCDKDGGFRQFGGRLIPAKAKAKASKNIQKYSASDDGNIRNALAPSFGLMAHTGR